MSPNIGDKVNVWRANGHLWYVGTVLRTFAYGFYQVASDKGTQNHVVHENFLSPAAVLNS